MHKLSAIRSLGDLFQSEGEDAIQKVLPAVQVSGVIDCSAKWHKLWHTNTLLTKFKPDSLSLAELKDDQSARWVFNDSLKAEE